MSVHLVEHPLAKHLLGQIRDRDTKPERFRRLARTLSTILILEATRSLETEAHTVETPLEPCNVEALRAGLVVVPILRAGLAMLEPVLEMFPDVAVGYIGLERSHDTAIAHSYYCKLPKMQGRQAICFDPMLATGGSASQALSVLKSHGAQQPILVVVVATPEGLARIETDHPDVRIYSAGLDRGLNDAKYILPGLGDFGDRLYGTL